MLNKRKEKIQKIIVMSSRMFLSPITVFNAISSVFTCSLTLEKFETKIINKKQEWTVLYFANNIL